MIKDSSDGEMRKNEQIWKIITGKISMTYWQIR